MLRKTGPDDPKASSNIRMSDGAMEKLDYCVEVFDLPKRRLSCRVLAVYIRNSQKKTRNKRNTGCALPQKRQYSRTNTSRTVQGNPHYLFMGLPTSGDLMKVFIMSKFTKTPLVFDILGGISAKQKIWSISGRCFYCFGKSGGLGKIQTFCRNGDVALLIYIAHQ